MRSMFKNIILFLFIPPVLASPAVPCCHITYKNVTQIGLFENIKEIHFNSVETCGGVNVARVYTRGPGNITQVICANGFNVMSFLLAVSVKAGERTIENRDSFREQLKASLHLFASKFSVKTADTSIFKFGVYRGAHEGPRTSS
ncbi:envelope glycoprotein L [Common bottlenose dolphin gammaherpesvirus 1 strain Sarasota]|uniref:Envelope glycoprotein L n=1 Tax=Common bottlenose dolphin gammaherpesvirus 1 strain Sarasota TaxID=2022783 RepID=A0A1Z1NE98_9GAMA|nr:envelope glycoprotein L [Common bottlenose dolphin gammaherpesvirus 1 strain Sarasota]ARW78109.1 envelope glycoprotein L [Common bottlenose dolphin gammaherpesvirus 1 strain Sarasota]